MHRFGRTAQQKMSKDRWGGGFILATILAVVAAWYAGDGLAKLLNKGPGTAGLTSVQTKGNSIQAAEPGDFSVHFIQVGAFRSDAKAKALAKKLSDASYTAMVTPRNADGFSMVYVGPYSNPDALNNAKAALTEMKPDVAGAIAHDINVTHSPDTVPAIAALGNKGTDAKKGLDTLNSYLHEVASWMEARAAGSADTSVLSAHGKLLGDMAKSMAAEKDASVKALADLMTRASNNAAQFDKAASSPMSGDDVQAAMSEYLTVLDQYRSLQAH